MGGSLHERAPLPNSPLTHHLMPARLRATASRPNGAAPMADESVASIIPWHSPQAGKSPAKGSRVAKPRKPSKPKSNPGSKSKTKAAASEDELRSSESLIAPNFMEQVEAL